MWGSLQLDWPFSLVVVVITITSCSHRSPYTDDCKYSTPACMSVCPSTVVGSLLYVAAISPVFCPTSHPFSLLHSLTSLICPISLSSCSFPLFLSYNSVCLSRRQKHGAFLTGSDRSHPQQSMPHPLSSWTLSSNRKWYSSLAPGVALFLLMHCVLLTGTLVGWLWSLSGLVSGVLPHLQPAPFPSFWPSSLPPLSTPFLPVWTVSCSSPPVWVCCLHLIYFNTAVFSQYTVQHCTVLYVSLQTCHVGLSWFGFMFCCYFYQKRWLIQVDVVQWRFI